MDKRKLQQGVHWTLTGLIALYIISGLGISQYKIMEKITFGLFTKVWAFKLHSYLLIPFLIVLIAHIYLALSHKRTKK